MSNTVALDFGRALFGPAGGLLFAFMVAFSCLGALNGEHFTKILCQSLTLRRCIFHDIASDICCRSGVLPSESVWEFTLHSKDSPKCITLTSCAYHHLHNDWRWFQIIDQFCCGSLMGFLFSHRALFKHRQSSIIPTLILGTRIDSPSRERTYVREVSNRGFQSFRFQTGP